MPFTCPVCRKNAVESVSIENWRCPVCGFARSSATDTPKYPVTSSLPDWIQEALAAAQREAESLEFLEIGCGEGERLEQARELGFVVAGVETSKTLRQRARHRLPGTFIVQSLNQLPPHSFDFVLLTGVLESATDPYTPFYTLFTKNIITTRTKILVDMVMEDASTSKQNIFSAQALKTLFCFLNFLHCEITELLDVDNVRHLRCIAYGSEFANFMQERYVPGTWSELTDYEHLPRYDYASRLATDRDVLDFGCGTGYGSRKLAEHARKVLAVDIDNTALKFAIASHDVENLRFLHNADLATSLNVESFDIITCFEVIEHIPAEQQATLVKNLSRLLKPGGILLISTPNPAVTALYGENPYHLHEMRLEEFRALISETFPYVWMLLQNISASVSLQVEGLQEDDTLIHNPNLFSGNCNTAVYIAVCAKAELPIPPSVIYQDQKHDFISNHVDTLRNNNIMMLERVSLVRLQFEKEKLLDRINISEAKNKELLDRAKISEVKNKELLDRVKAFETKNKELSDRVKVSEVKGEELTEQIQNFVESQNSLNAQLKLAQEEQHALSLQYLGIKEELTKSMIAHDQLQAQTEYFRLRLEQIEQSTSWRTLRRIQPLLSKLRPALRPPLRLAYRAYRRLNSRPLSPKPLSGPVSPTWPPRNLALELRLDPVWNEIKGQYELNCDAKTPFPNPDKSGQPYHIVPFHQSGPAKKRILHIIANVFIGGSTQLVIDLVQHLPRPYNHSILTSALWRGGAHTGIELYHVPKPDPTAIAEVLDKLRPDMVHMHYWGLDDEAWYQAALDALRSHGIPVVQNVNTPIAPLLDAAFESYVFVSQYVLEHFGKEAQTSGANLRVIHPGIDLSLFEDQDCASDAHNAIGMVYRLEHDKLNDDSIELLIEVVKRRPRTRAYVVGGGSLLQPFLERTERAGVRENFRFTGYVPYASLPQWYEKFRIFVAPVWKESFGQVAPFAMRKGCAVAGYDVGALAEILGSRDTLGNSLEEVTEIIVELLNDRQRLDQIGAENNRRAGELFGLTKMIESYTLVYDRMISK